MSKRITYDWPATVKTLRRNKGRWLLIYSDVPLAAAKIVRQRRHPALRLEGEVVRPNPMNVYTTRQGQRRCDLYLMLEDTDPPVVG